MPSSNDTNLERRRGGRGRSRGGRGGGRRSGQPHGDLNDQQNSGNLKPNKCLMVLHGNRQTGQLLLGRMEKLRKRILKEFQMDCVAPEAPYPHPEDSNLRTWWNRDGNEYHGLDLSLDILRRAELEQASKGIEIIGILGFSQGARLAHLVAILHSQDPEMWFPRLRFAILVAGYTAPLPGTFPGNKDATRTSESIRLSTLHVWGKEDPLISPDQSRAVMAEYVSPKAYEHDGKHYVPMKAPDIQAYVDFIRLSLKETSSEEYGENLGRKTHLDCLSPIRDVQPTSSLESVLTRNILPAATSQAQQPDEESAMMQQDEVQALEAIFPDELVLISNSKKIDDDEVIFEYPIIYNVKLLPSEDLECRESTNWPKRELTLEVSYPYNYPLETIPNFRLLHQNNIYEFPSARLERLQQILIETATTELGIPGVLSCVYAARDFLDSPAMAIEIENPEHATVVSQGEVTMDVGDEDEHGLNSSSTVPINIKFSTPEQIQECIRQGLDIAREILKLQSTSSTVTNVPSGLAVSNTKAASGGSYGTFTIGLVGKPSAGKSTFFNAATAFCRKQRGSNEDVNNKVNDGDLLGGASMAPHPFTTIDPNIGYCLVPAPMGSCPEDDIDGVDVNVYGSTHGRDDRGRRFLPVLLKDVAGLVPGAYQGRGRGNQFLNDLCDATVLIHVVDASGMADAQGNAIHDTDGDCESEDSIVAKQPLEDLAWIRGELVEWVCTNLMDKWDSVCRKGRTKLAGMFSGYGQTEAETLKILTTLAKYMEDKQHRNRPLDNIDKWDQSDLHRLVSAFLGVRFPMALALNKCDLPSSAEHVEQIQNCLPIHGAHVATPLAARSEMNFVRDHLLAANSPRQDDKVQRRPPTGVWQCLTSAMKLREPVLVFPVNDMETYAPLPGLSKVAVGHPSLPSRGMVTCIKAAGGTPPSCWDDGLGSYASTNKGKATNNSSVLRDVILMKPGSTVEDVFLTLKRLGALSGEFVRAEGASMIGEKPKPVPKHEVVGKNARIIKIMSTKRTQWQS